MSETTNKQLTEKNLKVVNAKGEYHLTKNILLFLHRGHQKLKLQLKTSLKTTTVVHRVPFKSDTISSKFREYVEFVGSSQDRRDRRVRRDNFFCFDHNHFPSVSKFLFSICTVVE